MFNHCIQKLYVINEADRYFYKLLLYKLGYKYPNKMPQSFHQPKDLLKRLLYCYVLQRVRFVCCPSKIWKNLQVIEGCIH